MQIKYINIYPILEIVTGEFLNVSSQVEIL